MKNAVKFGFLALAISLSVAACSSEKKGDSTMADTSMSVMDTMSTDSAAMDTMATDTMMKDTMKK
ncbi:hypothetical protein [Pedobacter sp. V48]|uniref:hypothetical protein n=1 Tax=Pedobacter sp. V48 TaxID=509635 RepID=UPI0003E48208|nr:hypothetical protein [Pedobacter sp. V48]ETZ19557.1 hypothetical protein N824_12510 [Pedobacter sp. V48]